MSRIMVKIGHDFHIICIYNTYNDIIIFKRICKIEGQNGYNKED
jgi:hypothetical protein